jgi:hypothetical protein
VILELGLGLGAVALTAYALRKVRSRMEGGVTEEPAAEDGDEPEPKRKGPRGLRVGDVLLYADTELWLAAHIELDEEGFVLRLFQTPGGGERAEWVVQLDEEARDLALARVTDEVPDGRVPAELPIGGFRLSLRRRGHARVRTAGEGLPPLTERAEYVELGGPGGRGLLVLDFEGGDRMTLAMERLGRELFDLLPGGD